MKLNHVIAVGLMAAAAAFGQLLPSGGSATNLASIGGNSTVTGGVNGSLGVGGLAAVDAATAGNPVYVGGIFETTPTVIENGDAGALHLDANQNLLVSLTTALPAGTSNIGDVDILTFPDNEPFNVAQIGGAAVLTGNGATGTGSQRVTIASDQTAFNVFAIEKTACGSTNFSTAWVAVPTTPGDATTSTTCVDALVFTNTNGAAETVTVTDRQGSPITTVATYSIPANSTVIFPFHGTTMTSGINWVAGGTGVTGAIHGWQ